MEILHESIDTFNCFEIFQNYSDIKGHKDDNKYFELPDKKYKKAYYFYENKNNNSFENESLDDFDYLDEGGHMHHCVNSYLERERSVIISIRKMGTKERVTCEYNAANGFNIQSKYFNNQQPPDDFKKVIEILNTKVLSFANKKILKSKEKVKTMFKLPVTGKKPVELEIFDLY